METHHVEDVDGAQALLGAGEPAAHVSRRARWRWVSSSGGSRTEPRDPVRAGEQVWVKKKRSAEQREVGTHERTGSGCLGSSEQRGWSWVRGFYSERIAVSDSADFPARWLAERTSLHPPSNAGGILIFLMFYDDNKEEQILKGDYFLLNLSKISFSKLFIMCRSSVCWC